MYGHRYFGRRYYGPRYFGDGGEIGIAVAAGPALVREPRKFIGAISARRFTYDGRATIYVGGDGRTRFQPSPQSLQERFRGRAGVQLGGEGTSCFIDPAAEIRRLDDEFILML